METRVPLYVPNPNLAGIVNAAAEEAFAHAQNTASTLQANKRADRRREEMNKEIYWVLEKTTGQKPTRDPDAWYVWWRQQNYMPINAKETKSSTTPRFVDVPYVPYIPPNIPMYTAGPIASMSPQDVARKLELLRLRLRAEQAAYAVGILATVVFALGTKVWTLTGHAAIENLKVGDQVLSQDPFTGELTYKPVLKTTVGNQKLVSIDVGSEKIEATLGHVFWVSGSGWRMAADLKVGDRLHSTSGWSEVVGLKDVPSADTRNLIVADYGTYFVGDKPAVAVDDRDHAPALYRQSAGR